MITVPHFENEAQDADWWYDHRHEVEDEFLRTLQAGVKPGPSRALRAMAEARGISLEEFQQQLGDKRLRSTKTEPLTKLPRSA